MPPASRRKTSAPVKAGKAAPKKAAARVASPRKAPAVHCVRASSSDSAGSCSRTPISEEADTVPRARRSSSQARTSSSRTTTTAAASTVRGGSVTFIGDAEDAAVPAGVSASSMHTINTTQTVASEPRLSSVYELCLSPDDCLVDSDDDEEETNKKNGGAGVGPRDGTTREEGARTVSVDFDDAALEATRVRLQERLTRTLASPSSSSSSSSGTLLAELACRTNGHHQFFYDGFRLTMDASAHDATHSFANTLPCEAESLRSPPSASVTGEKRARSGSRQRRATMAVAVDGEKRSSSVRSPHQPHVVRTGGECLLEPTATSLYRTDYADVLTSSSAPPRSALAGPTHGRTAASTAAASSSSRTMADPPSLRLFLREELHACYACEDAVIDAHRRAEMLTECRESRVAQQLYAIQHPPRPKDALCLRTGKRHRAEHADTAADEEDVDEEDVRAASIFETDASRTVPSSMVVVVTDGEAADEVCTPIMGGRSGPPNAFDMLAAQARRTAQRRAPRTLGRCASEEAATVAGADRADARSVGADAAFDALRAREAASAAVRAMEHHMQAFYREQQKRRQAAHAAEEAAHSRQRLWELPVLIDDAVQYVEHVLAFHAAARLPRGTPTCREAAVPSTASATSISASPSMSTTVSAVGPVVYGDSAVPLYGRYPPPLFRTSTFTTETIRLLKWLRTWRRQGHGRHADGSAGAAPRPARTEAPSVSGGTRTKTSVDETPSVRVPLKDEEKPPMTTTEKATGLLNAGAPVPCGPASVATAPTDAQTVSATKKKVFLSFFGAAAKVVVKDELDEAKTAVMVAPVKVEDTPAETGEEVLPSSGTCITAPEAPLTTTTTTTTATTTITIANPATTSMATAQELYKRRWQHAVRHPSASSFAASSTLSAATPSSPRVRDGSAALVAPPPPRAVRGLPFFAEMVEEQQDGVLLGSTPDAYCDAYGNRLRSARLAQKELEKRVAEDAARRKLERKKGYFARDDASNYHAAGDGGVPPRAGGLDALLFARRQQEQQRREEARRQRRQRRRRRHHRDHGATRDGASSLGSSHASDSSNLSDSDSSRSQTSDDEASSDRRGSRASSVASSSSACTVDSASSSAASPETVSSSSSSPSSRSSSSTGSDERATKGRGRTHAGRRRQQQKRKQQSHEKRRRTSSEAKKPVLAVRPVSSAAKAKLAAEAAGAGHGAGDRDGEEEITNIAVVSGPCGSGKTASVYLAAQILGYRVVEMNASVKRSPKNVEHLLAELTRSYRLTGLQQGRSSVTVEEELSKLKREHDALIEKLKLEAIAAEAEAEKKRKEARRANAISANAVAAFFKTKSQTKATGPRDVSEVVEVEHESPIKAVEAVVAPVALPPDPVHSVSSGGGGGAPAAASAPSAGTLLLFDDADVLLDDESFKPFYAAIRDLAHKSKVPIIVTVTTPASPLSSTSASSTAGSGSASSRRAANTPSLPLFCPRYPKELPSLSGAAPVHTSASAMVAMEEAALRFTDELSSPHFLRSTFTQIPFSSAAAAGFFGRQTPFTQLASPSRTALFVQLLLVGATELEALYWVPDTMKAGPVQLPQGGGLTELCDRLLTAPKRTSSTAATTAEMRPSARMRVEIRPECLSMVHTLADRLRYALFGTTTTTGQDVGGPRVAAFDEAVLAEAATTDVRFWLNHLQMLLLTMTPAEDDAAADMDTRCTTATTTTTTPAASLIADCADLSRWDQQRGRYHDCLVRNDADCPRQRCWELSAWLTYDDDIVDELATVHHPTRHVDYGAPSVFERAAAEQALKTKAKRARTGAVLTAAAPASEEKSVTARPVSANGKRGRGENKRSEAKLASTAQTTVADDDDDDLAEEDDDVVVAPQKLTKRGRGRPPSTAAALATPPSTVAPSSLSPVATKPSMWSLFSTPKSTGGETEHTSSPLSPPTVWRRIEGAGPTASSATTPSVVAVETPSAAQSLPSSMFADCAAFFAPLPVALVLPYGLTQRYLFAHRHSLTTAPPALAEDHALRSRQQRWHPLLAERPRSAAVMGLTPAGAVVPESTLAECVASPYTRVAGTQETSVAHRMTQLRRWWSRPRKADAAKRLVPGHGMDALEDYLGFATTLMAPPRS